MSLALSLNESCVGICISHTITRPFLLAGWPDFYNDIILSFIILSEFAHRLKYLLYVVTDSLDWDMLLLAISVHLEFNQDGHVLLVDAFNSLVLVTPYMFILQMPSVIYRQVKYYPPPPNKHFY